MQTLAERVVLAFAESFLKVAKGAWLPTADWTEAEKAPWSQQWQTAGQASCQSRAVCLMPGCRSLVLLVSCEQHVRCTRPGPFGTWCMCHAELITKTTVKLTFGRCQWPLREHIVLCVFGIVRTQKHSQFFLLLPPWRRRQWSWQVREIWGAFRYPWAGSCGEVRSRQELGSTGIPKCEGGSEQGATRRAKGQPFAEEAACGAAKCSITACLMQLPAAQIVCGGAANRWSNLGYPVGI